jgi:hypothetical protein
MLHKFPSVAALFCWITQDFELYAAFHPLADKVGVWLSASFSNIRDGTNASTYRPIILLFVHVFGRLKQSRYATEYANGSGI